MVITSYVSGLQGLSLTIAGGLDLLIVDVNGLKFKGMFTSEFEQMDCYSRLLSEKAQLSSTDSRVTDCNKVDASDSPSLPFRPNIEALEVHLTYSQAKPHGLQIGRKDARGSYL